MRVCATCGKDYVPRDVSYHRNQRRCQECFRATWIATQRRNRVKQLCRRNGITIEHYQTMYAEQNGCCAICGEKEPPPVAPDERATPNGVLNVDHDHSTGKVRGLLCFGCNTALGSFRDSIIRLEAAIGYLRRTTTVVG